MFKTQIFEVAEPRPQTDGQQPDHTGNRESRLADRLFSGLGDLLIAAGKRLKENRVAPQLFDDQSWAGLP